MTAKTYKAIVRVIYMETWSVEAESEKEARKKFSELYNEVDVEGDAGEVVDWEVQSIEESGT